MGLGEKQLTVLYDQFGKELVTSVQQASRVIGTPGLQNLAGRIQEEYERDLKPWSKAINVFLEMRDNITVATLLDSIKLPLLSSDFDVEPFSDAPGDIDAKNFLWDNMIGMERQS